MKFVLENNYIFYTQVLMRLTELIKLEDSIKLHLKRAPADYVTPRCQFIPSQVKFKIQNGICGTIATPKHF